MVVEVEVIKRFNNQIVEEILERQAHNKRNQNKMLTKYHLLMQNVNVC